MCVTTPIMMARGREARDRKLLLARRRGGVTLRFLLGLLLVGTIPFGWRRRSPVDLYSATHTLQNIDQGAVGPLVRLILACHAALPRTLALHFWCPAVRWARCQTIMNS